MKGGGGKLAIRTTFVTRCVTPIKFQKALDDDVTAERRYTAIEPLNIRYIDKHKGWKVPWKEIIGGILVGALLGVAATFFSLYQKIIDVESQLNQRIASVERRLKVVQTPSSLTEGSATDRDVASPKDGGSARIILTTGLDESKGPKDDLDSFKLGVYFYVYVDHFGLTPGKTYKQIVRILDSNNAFIDETHYSFIPKDAGYSAWSRYTPKKGIDKPGIWNVKVELNGIEVSSRSIRVELP